MTKLEEVARAIWTTYVESDIAHRDATGLSWDGLLAIAPGKPGLEALVATCRAEARAAITALREPTEAMKDAGAPLVGGDEIGPYSAADDVWRAMIDALLAEKS